MLLKHIKLSNIRSYKDLSLDLPEGSVMLSGDIGSGKSTILQAVEFALFGITKEVSGSSLLRNGESAGSVELHFNVENKDVAIKRTLKRSSSSVTQDHGHLIVNGKKIERTASELKQEIINLLQYPQELLTKKSMIYRYTVYTPQEEMKRILFEEKEQRLDTLRRVFGIDKYKNICQATEIFVAGIKLKSKELSGMTLDTSYKEEERNKKKKDLENINSSIKSLEPALVTKKKQLEECKLKLKRLESEKANLEAIQRDLAATEASLSHKESDLKKAQERIKKLEEEKIKIASHLKKLPFSVNKEDVNQKSKELEETEAKIRRIRDSIQALRTLKAQAEKNIYDLKSFDICPTCKQKVTKDHIHSLSIKDEKDIKDCDHQLSILEKDLKIVSDLQSSLKENVEKLKEMMKEEEIIKIQQENLANKEEELKAQNKTLNEVNKEVLHLREKKSALDSRIAPYARLNKEYESFRKESDIFQEEEEKLAIEHSSLKVKSADIDESLRQLENELKARYKVKEQIEGLKQMQHWLEEFFVPLVMTMEKSVMLKVHHDFDQLFQKWFSIIIDNETLKIRLDNEFTPMIEQNGHEIEYSFLSGGEKTAAALAYRLALNQVINTLVSTIKTRDLIVLDEPTDGFSSEQLDRIRIVLDELKMKQIIIVSHESEIESFVNKIIRLEKHGHLTRVVP